MIRDAGVELTKHSTPKIIERWLWHAIPIAIRPIICQNELTFWKIATADWPIRSTQFHIDWFGRSVDRSTKNSALASFDPTPMRCFRITACLPWPIVEQRMNWFERPEWLWLSSSLSSSSLSAHDKHIEYTHSIDRHNYMARSIQPIRSLWLHLAFCCLHTIHLIHSVIYIENGNKIHGTLVPGSNDYKRIVILIRNAQNTKLITRLFVILSPTQCVNDVCLAGWSCW